MQPKSKPKYHAHCVSSPKYKNSYPNWITCLSDLLWRAAPAAAAGKKQAQPKSAAGAAAAGPSEKAAVDNFGANGRMTPSLESWCKEQMQKLIGSDDLILVSFCMTLTDRDEIRQYLTACLGSTPQVNNFATEFIKRKD